MGSVHCVALRVEKTDLTKGDILILYKGCVIWQDFAAITCI